MFDNLKNPYILDGAFGSNLIAAGMPSGACVEQWILNNPDAYKKIVCSYVAAGSMAVYAPTMNANRTALRAYGLENEVVRLNKELAALTKSCVPDGILVGGDVSQSGLFIPPFGDTAFEEIVSIYSEQIEALKEAEVDFIAAETLCNLSDARAAVIASGKAGLPVIVTLTVNADGRTMWGTSPLAALIILEDMGVSAFGLNCSDGPANMKPVIQKLAEYNTVPLIVKPNASLPSDTLPADEFAKQIAELIDCGASIAGGCCGTTGEHIEKMVSQIKNKKVKSLNIRKNKILANERKVFFDEETEKIILNTNEDLEDFIENCNTKSGPIKIIANNNEILKKALGAYQGNADGSFR